MLNVATLPFLFGLCVGLCLSFTLPDVDFRISCSKGTYIRSLARYFGEALNGGAHLTSLRRTRIGEFKLADAHELEGLMAELTKLSEIEKGSTETDDLTKPD